MGKASGWRSLFSSSFILVVPCLICFKFTYAANTLFPGQFLNASQSLVSKNGVFKLGVDCSIPQNDCGLGIWFAKSSSCNHGYFPVWQPDQGCLGCYVSSYNLSVSEDGMLHIKSIYAYGFWSSSHLGTASFSAVAVLLDNGNLVVRDRVNSSMVTWQSFDNPINILLPGGLLGLNTITGTNVTLVSIIHHDDYYRYTTLSLDTTRKRGFIIQRNNDGMMFAGTFPRWMNTHENGGNALTFNDSQTYIYLNRSGFINLVKQEECNSVLWSAPETLCDFDSHGPGGFGPYLTVELGAGCVHEVPLNCESIATQPEVIFSPVDAIHRYPRNARISKAVSMRDCESSCLRDCNCTAFAFNTTCLLWFSELWYTVVNSSVNGNRMYIRIATNQQRPGSRAVLLSVIGVLTLVAIVLVLLWRCRRKLFTVQTVDAKGDLIVFSYAQIKNSTKNFTEKLGEGGFGCVFKGTVPLATTVAVKMLKNHGQGDKQFRAEVQTLGMIQHINLVRLLGFCADGSRKLLVYEYMVNGSLNYHLFSRSSAKLIWELRYHVALGTARGLSYLHEECKDYIVHCDLKPDNILLDGRFCPKIADFGMAKLLGRDFSRVLTTMRGTIGYLAPEWISGLPITYKADVYSYGMMLLEIISGRRNSEKIKEGKFTYFPTYAAVKLNEGDVMCLLDSSLEGNADADQLNRACKVACWCIQDAEDHRPTMGQVVRMLEGVLDVKVPPIPRSLQNYVGMEDSYSEDLDSF